MVKYPSDWQQVKVRRIGYVKTGGTPDTKNKSLWGKEIVWITPTDINNTVYISSSDRKLSKKGFENAVKLKKGTVLVTCIASIGKNTILNIEGSCNQQINAIEVNKNNDNLFVYYLMEFNKKLLESKAGVTTTLMLSKKTFKEIGFTIPEIVEQRAISKVLLSFDTHITNLTNLIEKKQMIRDRAVEELVSGKRRLDGFNGEWENQPLLKIAEILNGLTYRPENVKSYGKLVLRSSNIQNERLVFHDNVYVDENIVNTKNVEIGDIVICVRNGSAALIGKSARVNKEINATIGAFMANIRCSNKKTSGFLYYFTKTEAFQSFVNEILGATINQITKSDFERLKLMLPLDENEQEAIAKTLSSIDKEIENLEQEKEKYEQLKQGAMDDLLTGKVRLI